MTKTQVSSPEGTICRQLLPLGANVVSNRGAYRHLYRWVTWYVEPVTLELAWAHLVQAGNCVVQVTRGPNGGWSGAVFITSAHVDLPTQKQLQRPRTVPNTKDATNTPSLYLGFLQERIRPNYNMPKPLPPIDIEQYRTHLLLHAPVLD